MADSAKPVQWFYGRDGVQRGPFLAEDLRQQMRDGAVARSDLVWREGRSEWIEAGKLPEFSGQFPELAATPPDANGNQNPARLHDPSSQTFWLVSLLRVQIAVAAVMLAIEVAHYWLLLNAPPVTADDETQKLTIGNIELVRNCAGLIAIALAIGTIATFATWTARANFNIRQLGAAGLTFSPAWATGWYFVPGWNIWKPFVVMCEIWRASRWPETWTDEKDWQMDRASSSLPWWWMLVLLASAAIVYASQKTILAADPDQKISASMWWLIAHGLLMTAALAAIIVVRQIHAFQVKRRNLLSGAIQSQDTPIAAKL